MRRLAPVLALAAVMAIAGTAVAKQPSKLQTFGDGDVTITGGTVTLHNAAGEYSGVYLASRSLSAKRLRAVHISFHSSGDTAGGAPRFSIPLNTGQAESVPPYAFLDVNNCASGDVSTDNDACKVFLNFSSEWFDNWDDLVTTHPRWRVAAGKIPFIIADQPGTYVISNIDLR
jgi:hypothetical protein